MDSRESIEGRIKMKSFFKNKNNVIIGLCAIVILMGIGFAAFSQRLEIGDTTVTNSDWNVYIKSAVAGTPVGGATGSAQVVDRASAKLTANLSSPGDSVTYTITVANDGNIDAVLDLITLSASNSDSVIKYSYSGIEEDEELLAQTETSFTVKIEYDSTKTGTVTDAQKQNTLTLDLDFVQASEKIGEGSIPEGEAYALLLNNSANSQTDTTPLVFVRSTEEFNVGETYNNMIIEAVYSDIETTNYRDYDDETDSDGIYPGWTDFDVSVRITSVSVLDEIFPISCYGWFAYMMNLQTIDLSNLNTRNVTNMASMFEYTPIETLELSHFDTSNVTNMSRMFSGTTIETLDLNNFNTSSVTDMSSMFSNSVITTLKISGFDTSKVTDMYDMFGGPSIKLTEIELGSNFSFKGACTDSSDYAILPESCAFGWRNVVTNSMVKAEELQESYPSTSFPPGTYRYEATGAPC